MISSEPFARLKLHIMVVSNNYRVNLNNIPYNVPSGADSNCREVLKQALIIMYLLSETRCAKALLINLLSIKLGLLQPA